MMDLVREAQENKKKLVLSILVVVMTLVAAVPLFVISGILETETWLRWTLIGIGCVVLVMGIIIACILDREAGAFECPECHERFVPSMRAYVMSTHTLTKRRLRCPHCGERHYCKKVMTK